MTQVISVPYLEIPIELDGVKRKNIRKALSFELERQYGETANKWIKAYKFKKKNGKYVGTVFCVKREDLPSQDIETFKIEKIKVSIIFKAKEKSNSGISVTSLIGLRVASLLLSVFFTWESFNYYNLVNSTNKLNESLWQAIDKTSSAELNKESMHIKALNSHVLLSPKLIKLQNALSKNIFITKIDESKDICKITGHAKVESSIFELVENLKVKFAEVNLMEIEKVEGADDVRFTLTIGGKL